MSTHKIGKFDLKLEQLIGNLKLTKPQAINYYKKQTVNQQPSNINQIVCTKINQNQQDSLIVDNYEDLDCYSFYQLQNKQTKNSQNIQFSFSHSHDNYINKQITTQDSFNSISRFSSIVDKLKTQGDQHEYTNQCFFFENQNSEAPSTQRNIIYNPKSIEKKSNKYFSDNFVKQNQKTYRNLSHKSSQKLFKKKMIEPIYAKLQLQDKQNIYSESNKTNKKGVLTSLLKSNKKYQSSSKKQDGIKKPIFCASQQSQKLFSQKIQMVKDNKNAHEVSKVKDLNQKIRKENHIIYQSQVKQKQIQASHLLSFKKSNIQPHKFSTYKVKLFG